MRRLWILGLLLSSAFALAESETPLSLSGSLDLNYVYNWNQPDPVTSPSDSQPNPPVGANRYRLLDQFHDQMGLALALLELKKQRGPASVFVQFAFGHGTEALSPHDEVSRNILQAYVTYVPKELPRLSLRAGKMLTHMGLEVVKTRDNWNTSHSVLFIYAIPYWNTGISGLYDLDSNKNWNASLYLYNENVGLYETGRGKTFGAQMHYGRSDQWNWTYNNLLGTETDSQGVTHWRALHEWLSVYPLNAHWGFSTDFVYGQLSKARAEQQKTAEWLAWTLGAQWKSGTWALSPRFEVYVDRSGASVETQTVAKPALPQSLESVTLTLRRDLGDGLEARVEARRDHSSSNSFLAKDETYKTEQTTLSVALLYDF